MFRAQSGYAFMSHNKENNKESGIWETEGERRGKRRQADIGRREKRRREEMKWKEKGREEKKKGERQSGFVPTSETEGSIED